MNAAPETLETPKSAPSDEQFDRELEELIKSESRDESTVNVDELSLPELRALAEAETAKDNPTLMKELLVEVLAGAVGFVLVGYANVYLMNALASAQGQTTPTNQQALQNGTILMLGEIVLGGLVIYFARKHARAGTQHLIHFVTLGGILAGVGTFASAAIAYFGASGPSGTAPAPTLPSVNQTQSGIGPTGRTVSV